MPRGTVTAFDANGFGFIAPDVGGGEVWMRSRVPAGTEQPSLAEGERVAFDVAYGSMGVEAINVRACEQ